MADSGATPDTRPQVFLRERMVGGRWEMRSFRIEGYEDGTIFGLEDAHLLADAYETWNTRVVDGRLVIWVNPERAPRAPDLWYCAIPDTSSERSAAHLVAFATDDVAPGTVVPDTEFFAMPVRSDQQVYLVRGNGTHELKRFDKLTDLANQSWAFNHVTSGEVFTGMKSLHAVFFPWENQSLTATEITSQVSTFINSTKVAPP